MKKSKKSLFFISTNEVWSGSEELWYESALLLMESNVDVGIAVKYEHQKIDAIKNKVRTFFDVRRRFGDRTFFNRILNKLSFGNKKRDLLLKVLVGIEPDLVIISQGNNISSEWVMNLCVQGNLKFVTITQLVTEVHFLHLNNNNYKWLRNLYNQAIANYFVSKANLKLHELMFAYTASNSEVIFNPFILSGEKEITYPSTQDGYKVAFVGRIECFHKGLDILMQVLMLKKWKDREIIFNIYGNGPHTGMIEDITTNNNIPNLQLKGFSNSVEDVWNNNHLLILPSRMEGQSLSLIEAMFCGRAAVVTNAGGAVELIEEGLNGFIAESATVEALDRALENAWLERNNWKALGLNAAYTVKLKSPANPVKYFTDKILNVVG